jgi:pimeloyl-ACP methyl ester carboxylesterase
MRDEIMQLRSGDFTLSTRVAGSGPLVILMHGWPELGISWRHQILPLAQAGFTVAAPDMRGYGGSSKPEDPAAYRIDTMADDMAAIADGLGHQRWVSVGHDWGSPVAWRTALRFPDRVAAVFSLSVPHSGRPPMQITDTFDIMYPNRFYYIRYFQGIGPGEAELERDPRDALKRVYFSLSGDAPQDDWLAMRPIEGPLLPGLAPPPPGPLSFMTDAVLDTYTDAFVKGGFFGPISWYRNFERDYVDLAAYGDNVIHQPSGFLCGDKEIVLSMVPNALERQRTLLSDLRMETVLPGAGHWIQQERPQEVTDALVAFLRDVRPLL